MTQSFTLKLDEVEYSVEVNGDTVIIDGQPFTIGAEGNESVTVDGIAYEITLEGSKAIVNGIAYEYHASGLAAGPPPKGATGAVSAGQGPPAPTTAGVGAIQAIMPGTIVRILVAKGDAVTAGDVILVLEAMKMENELSAPVSGVVKALHVQQGQAVEMNMVLAEIEPLG